MDNKNLSNDEKFEILFKEINLLKSEINILKNDMKNKNLPINEIKNIKNIKDEISSVSLKEKEETRVDHKDSSHENRLKINLNNQNSMIISDKIKLSVLRTSLSFPQNNEFFSKIGFWTICSSVAAQNLKAGKRKYNIEDEFDDMNTKSALYGSSDDANNMYNYFLERSSEFVNQGKFEFSSESVSALGRDAFIQAIKNYFNSSTNQASIIYYSGHGFEDGKIMLETSSGSYYLEYEDIISIWRNRNYANINKHLFLIMDCCYAGKWVYNLLLHGDFDSVSIQASCTDKQKSNDLGKGKGSLFTGALLQANTNKTYLDYTDPKISNKLKTQVPIAFGFNDICINDYNFDKIIVNAWSELQLDYEKIISLISVDEAKNKKQVLGHIKLIAVESTDNNEDYFFEHLVMKMKDEKISYQGSIFNREKKIKANFEIIIPSSEITANNSGLISVYLDGYLNSFKLASYVGRYFNHLRKKEYVYSINQKNMSNAMEILYSEIEVFITNAELVKGNYYKQDISNDSLILLKEIHKELAQTNKAYLLIDNFEKDDEDFEEIDKDYIYDASLLESLVINNPLRNDVEAHSYLDQKCNFQKLTITLCKDTSKQMLYKLKSLHSLDELTINIKNVDYSQLSLLFESIFNLRLQKLSIINFDDDGELKKYIDSSDVVEGLELIKTLKSINIVNPKEQWKTAIINILKNDCLQEFIVEKCEFNTNDITYLNSFLETHKKIKRIILKDCNLVTPIAIPENIEYLDLSNNRYSNKELSLLLESFKNMKTRYQINLESIFFNNAALSMIKSFLIKNDNCIKFNISHNLVPPEFYLDFCSIFNYNRNMRILDLSYIKFSELKLLTNYLRNQKTVTDLIMKYNCLYDSKLNEIFGILNFENSNRITYLDVSGNKFYSLKELNKISAILRYKKNLTHLIMKDSVDLGSKAKEELMKDVAKSFSVSKPVKISLNQKKSGYNITMLMKNPTLEYLDISDWHNDLPFEFDNSKLSSIAIKSFICNNTDINFIQKFSSNNTEDTSIILKFLVIDSSQITFFSDDQIQIQSLKVITKANYDNKGYKENILNMIKSNSKVIESLDIDDSICPLNEVLEIIKTQKYSELIKKESNKINNKDNVNGKLNKLIIEDTDLESMILLFNDNTTSNTQNININNPIFNDKLANTLELDDSHLISKLKEENPNIKTTINKVKEYTDKPELMSKEMFDYISKNNNNNKDLYIEDIKNNYQLIKFFNDVKSVEGNKKYLSIFGNNYIVSELIDLIFKLKKIEVLEISFVCLSEILTAVKSSLTDEHNNLKCLIIRDCDINAQEIYLFKEIFNIYNTKTQSDLISLKEIHFIGSFIELKEADLLFEVIKFQKALETINISTNYWDKFFTMKFLNFINNYDSIKNIIMRESSIKIKNLYSILANIKKLDSLDISGFKVGLKAKEIIDTSNNTSKLLINYRNDNLSVNPYYRLNVLVLKFVDLDPIKKTLFSLLKNIPYLEEIQLIHCYKENILYKILSLLHKTCFFKSIKAKGCIINKNSSKHLKNIITHRSSLFNNNTLYSLDISNCQLTDDCFSIILDTIAESNIINLDLSNNMMTSYLFIFILEQLYYRKEENSQYNARINIQLQNSFSGNFSNDFNSLFSIFEYENSLIKNKELFNSFRANLIKDISKENLLSKKTDEDIEKLLAKHSISVAKALNSKTYEESNSIGNHLCINKINPEFLCKNESYDIFAKTASGISSCIKLSERYLCLITTKKKIIELHDIDFNKVHTIFFKDKIKHISLYTKETGNQDLLIVFKNDTDDNYGIKLYDLQRFLMKADVLVTMELELKNIKKLDDHIIVTKHKVYYYDINPENKMNEICKLKISNILDDYIFFIKEKTLILLFNYPKKLESYSVIENTFALKTNYTTKVFQKERLFKMNSHDALYFGSFTNSSINIRKIDEINPIKEINLNFSNIIDTVFLNNDKLVLLERNKEIETYSIKICNTGTEKLIQVYESPSIDHIQKYSYDSLISLSKNNRKIDIIKYEDTSDSILNCNIDDNSISKLSSLIYIDFYSYNTLSTPSFCLIGKEKGDIALFDIKTNSMVRKYAKIHTNPVTALEFHYQYKHQNSMMNMFISFSKFEKLCVWNLLSKNPLYSIDHISYSFSYDLNNNILFYINHNYNNSILELHNIELNTKKEIKLLDYTLLDQLNLLALSNKEIFVIPNEGKTISYLILNSNKEIDSKHSLELDIDLSSKKIKEFYKKNNKLFYTSNKNYVYILSFDKILNSQFSGKEKNLANVLLVKIAFEIDIYDINIISSYDRIIIASLTSENKINIYSMNSGDSFTSFKETQNSVSKISINSIANKGNIISCICQKNQLTLFTDTTLTTHYACDLSCNNSTTLTFKNSDITNSQKQLLSDTNGKNEVIRIDEEYILVKYNLNLTLIDLKQNKIVKKIDLDIKKAENLKAFRFKNSNKIAFFYYDTSKNKSSFVMIDTKGEIVSSIHVDNTNYNVIFIKDLKTFSINNDYRIKHISKDTNKQGFAYYTNNKCYVIINNMNKKETRFPVLSIAEINFNTSEILTIKNLDLEFIYNKTTSHKLVVKEPIFSIDFFDINDNCSYLLLKEKRPDSYYIHILDISTDLIQLVNVFDSNKKEEKLHIFLNDNVIISASATFKIKGWNISDKEIFSLNKKDNTKPIIEKLSLNEFVYINLQGNIEYFDLYDKSYTIKDLSKSKYEVIEILKSGNNKLTVIYSDFSMEEVNFSSRNRNIAEDKLE